ncbi:hypothetical protein HOE37_06520 [Candidatus Woesearchaeota archaeon]|jgi:hypothetical protein|nr:hypothetical protein [Candidatus Woesearchaeota archaeon]
MGNYDKINTSEPFYYNTDKFFRNSVEKNLEDSNLPLTIKREYKTGWNISFFSSIQEFEDSVRCDQACMHYLKSELGALDSDCDDSYDLTDFLEVYTRKCITYSVTYGNFPEGVKV